MTAMPDIIFVDDDVDVLESIEDYFSRFFSIVVFSSAMAALEYLRERGTKLLVTDLRMPGLNGFMLINEARTICPELKILLISGYIDASSDDERILYERYTPYCLSKPFKFSELQEKIEEILEGSP